MSYLDSLFGLTGKTAIVTGAARGNGKAMAMALGKAGANVVLVDVLATELRDTASQCAADGISARELCLDCTAPDAPSSIARQATQWFGPLHILVNNAGRTLSHPALSYPEAAWDATLSLNLKTPFLLAQAVAPSMAQAGGGSIINITSLNAEVAFPDNPAYVASKGGLKQLSKALALDLAPSRIRVNCLGPGYIHTDMTRQSHADPVRHRQRADRTMLGRWGEPADLAGAVVFLASDASAYVTGQDLYVDGGWLAKGL